MLNFPMFFAFKNSFASKGLILVVAVAWLAGTSAMAQVIDTFTGSLSGAYTRTTVLDNDTTRNVTFATNSGILQSIATTTTAAEQSLLLRSDFTLAIGQTLRADLPSFSAGSQDFGIAVATTSTPTGVAVGAAGDTRAGTGGYVFVGFRNTQNSYIAGGYNTTGTFTTTLGTTTPGTATAITAITGVFITRTSANMFTLGYNDNGGPDTTITIFTPAGLTVGNAVGFYSDMRAAGTIGNFDNLRIVPEPSSWVFLAAGAGLLTLVLRVRHTARA